MRDYIHWAVMGALCEFLPRYENSVTLAEETDRHGLPVADFSYSSATTIGPSKKPPRRFKRTS